MAKNDDLHIWLGNKAIQPETNRVSIPPQATETDLIQPGDSLFWGRTETDRIVVSRFKYPFEQSHNLTRFTDTNVQANRVAIIPKFFFADYDGPQKYSTSVDDHLQFEYGEPLHFMTTDTLLRDGLCYVLDQETTHEKMDKYLDDRFLQQEGMTVNAFTDSSSPVSNNIVLFEEGETASAGDVKRRVLDMVMDDTELVDPDVLLESLWTGNQDTSE